MKCPNCGKSLWFVKKFCPFCKTVFDVSVATSTASSPAAATPKTTGDWQGLKQFLAFLMTGLSLTFLFALLITFVTSEASRMVASAEALKWALSFAFGFYVSYRVNYPPAGEETNADASRSQILTPKSVAVEGVAEQGAPKPRHAKGDGPATAKPLFLHIPTGRLIVLSIASLSLYEVYWVYKNWRYIKERESLKISPFWRGIFGVFFCHSLLRKMHQDTEARAVQVPGFSPDWLATGWVVLSILENFITRIPGIAATIIAVIMPSFLCLAPVQNYVNEVTKKRNANEPYYGWSAGHIVCLVWGIIIWGLLLYGES